MSDKIGTVHWNDFPDIGDVQPLTTDDEACLAEIREVLRRRGALSRFGVTLMHRHFDMAEDEMLVEYPDTTGRRLVTIVEKAVNHNAATSTPTAWSLEGLRAAVRCVCARDDSSHLGYHREG